MDILSQLNLEQLGVSGLFIGFLIWLYIQRGKELFDEKEERRKAQGLVIDIARDSAQEVNESIRTLEKAMDFVQGRS